MLSFFSIFGIQHNILKFMFIAKLVVNCFHFSVSLGYNTTRWFLGRWLCRLWIAFIFQYLWDTTQRVEYAPIKFDCCELLSFFSIFGIQHNVSIWKVFIQGVVNCFHFSVSLGYNTTVQCLQFVEFVLWIAFIFQYLWDTTQLVTWFWFVWNGCELLSFFSIFGIQHNH